MSKDIHMVPGADTWFWFKKVDEPEFLDEYDDDEQHLPVNFRNVRDLGNRFDTICSWETLDEEKRVILNKALDDLEDVGLQYRDYMVDVTMDQVKQKHGNRVNVTFNRDDFLPKGFVLPISRCVEVHEAFNQRFKNWIIVILFSGSVDPYKDLQHLETQRDALVSRFAHVDNDSGDWVVN